MAATTETKTRTVRELKTETKKQWKKRGEDVASSVRHADWWNELNQLGWKRKSAEPEETKDIDATSVLTEDEYKKLRARIPNLEK